MSDGYAPTLAHPPDPSLARDQLAPAAHAFALGALRMALIIGALVTILLLSALVIGGAPWHWLATGVALVGLWILAASRPSATARLLARRHASTALAGTLSVVIALEGSWQSPFLAVGFALVAVSVVVDSGRRVAWCVAVSVVGYLAGFAVSGLPPGELTDSPRLAVVITNSLDFVIVGVLLFAAVGALRAVLASAASRLEEVRQGRSGFTPALSQAVRAADVGARAVLPRAPATAVTAELSEAERRVVSLLADGLAPKQAAVALGVGLPTVRSQLASAKRKTGSRTLEQLVGLTVEANLR